MWSQGPAPSTQGYHHMHNHTHTSPLACCVQLGFCHARLASLHVELRQGWGMIWVVKFPVIGWMDGWMEGACKRSLWKAWLVLWGSLVWAAGSGLGVPIRQGLHANQVRGSVLPPFVHLEEQNPHLACVEPGACALPSGLP